MKANTGGRRCVSLCTSPTRGACDLQSKPMNCSSLVATAQSQHSLTILMSSGKFKEKTEDKAYMERPETFSYHFICKPVFIIYIT